MSAKITNKAAKPISSILITLERATISERGGNGISEVGQQNEWTE